MRRAASCTRLLFNCATEGNYCLRSDRWQRISQDPAQIGLLLAIVYAVASATQLVVGHLLDKIALKTLYLSIIATQAVLLFFSMSLDGWAFYTIQFMFMAAVFGAIPFIDAMIVRFVDDKIGRAHV